jgi:RNA polymerase sigma-70 factor (ECF subfamily)
VDAFRRRKRHPAQSLEDLPEGQLSALAESGPLPDEILQREDVRVRVVLAMATLPDEYRTALAARYGDQRRVEEMAQLLGKSLKATESLLSRARKAFREALSRMETEEGNGPKR